MTSELDKVVKIRQRLEKFTQNVSPNKDEVLALLNTLQRCSVTLELLQRSGIGITLNRLRQKLGSSEAASLAKKLIKSWKKVLPGGGEASGSSKKAATCPTVSKKQSAHSPALHKQLASPKTSHSANAIKLPSSQNDRTKKPRRKAIKPFLSTLPPRPVPKNAPSPSHPIANGPSSSSNSPPSLANSILPSLPATATTGSVDATGSTDTAMKPAEGGGERGGVGAGGEGREGGGRGGVAGSEVGEEGGGSGGEKGEGGASSGRGGGGDQGGGGNSSVTEKRLTFPSDVSGSECSPSTGSEVRDRCRELIVRALKKGFDEVTLEEEYKFYNLGAQIEECVFESLGGESGSKYRQRVRSRVANLGDLKNAGLRQQVLVGHISPQQLATMTTQEMASDSLKKLREQLTKEAIRDAQVAQTDGAGGTKCDLIRCPECSKSNCSYTQAQTLASDEPMTTFAYCNDCGNRWIFY